MELLTSLLNVLISVWELLIALSRTILPYAALLCWIAFWMLAVNWETLYKVFWSGGWVGLALLVLCSVLIWGLVAPPETTHSLLGLEVSNFVGKFVKVALLVAITFLCGAVQLSGACACCVQFDEVDAEEHSLHDHDADHPGHHFSGELAHHPADGHH